MTTIYLLATNKFASECVIDCTDTSLDSVVEQYKLQNPDLVLIGEWKVSRDLEEVRTILRDEFIDNLIDDKEGFWYSGTAYHFVSEIDKIVGYELSTNEQIQSELDRCRTLAEEMIATYPYTKVKFSGELYKSSKTGNYSIKLDLDSHCCDDSEKPDETREDPTDDFYNEVVDHIFLDYYDPSGSKPGDLDSRTDSIVTRYGRVLPERYRLSEKSHLAMIKYIEYKLGESRDYEDHLDELSPEVVSRTRKALKVRGKIIRDVLLNYLLKWYRNCTPLDEFPDDEEHEWFANVLRTEHENVPDLVKVLAENNYVITGDPLDFIFMHELNQLYHKKYTLNYYTVEHLLDCLIIMKNSKLFDLVKGTKQSESDSECITQGIKKCGGKIRPVTVTQEMCGDVPVERAQKLCNWVCKNYHRSKAKGGISKHILEDHVPDEDYVSRDEAKLVSRLLGIENINVAKSGTPAMFFEADDQEDHVRKLLGPIK